MSKIKLSKRKLIVTVAMLPLLLLSAQAFGQTASVGGTVTDASQAVLPGALIKAINAETGVETTITTNNAGVYNMALTPGTYEVSAEMPGFQTNTRTDVEVGIGAALRLNFELQVSGVATEIEVSTSAADLLLESTSSTGVVMDEQVVKELPLLGNDMMQLINVMGGVVKQENTIFDSVNQALAGVTANNINVSRDGISVSEVRWSSGITSPGKLNPEMIGEFKLVLSPVDAELGRGAGQVQVMTKSGGNEYHGSGVWSVLNNALDAADWGENAAEQARTWKNVNQYTLSVGGPIIKNKTFFFATWDHNLVRERYGVNGRALTACARKGIYRYFPGWQPNNTNMSRMIFGVANHASVDSDGYPNPPDGMTIEDLEWGSVLGELTPEARDQIALDPINCSQYTFSFADTGVIPGTNWDRDLGNYRTGIDSSGFIEKFHSYMPETTNYYGEGDGLNVAAHRWTRSQSGSDTVFGTGFDIPRKSISGKIDHNITAEHRLSGTGSYETSVSDSGESRWPTAYGGWNDRKAVHFTGSLTSTLRPTLLNEFRVGMSYSESHNVAPLDNPNTGEDLEALLQELLPTDDWPMWSGLPYTLGPGAGDVFRFDPNSGNVLGGRNPYEDTWGSFDYRYSFSDTVTWTRGSHSFKFGFEFRLSKANSDRNGAGAWGENSPAWYPNIQGGYTANSLHLGMLDSRAAAEFPSLAGSPDPTDPTGNYGDIYDLLDYFAGSLATVRQYYFVNDPISTEWSDPTTVEGRVNKLAMDQREFAFFIKDDWKVNSDLTLNLGVRYEYYGVPWMIDGRTAGFVGGAADGIFGAQEGTFDNWLQPTASPNSANYFDRVAPFDPANATRFQFVGPNSDHPDKALFNKDLNNWGPAVGFAWQLPWFGRGKTTLRGGYQMNFVQVDRMDPNAGFMGSAGSQPSLTFRDTYAGSFGENEYMDISMLPQLVPTSRFWNESTVQPLQPIPLTNLLGSTWAYDPNIRSPYIQSLTLALTRQIGSNLTVDVRYIGTLSRKQVSAVNINNANFISNGLKEELDIVAAGEESQMINDMIPEGMLFDPWGFGWSGSQQLRSYSTQDLATGNYENIAYVLATANGNVPNVPSGVNGALLRHTGLFPENFIVTNPQFGGPWESPVPTTTSYYSNHNHSNYHSLQGQVTLRPTHGLNFQATYTWSRNLGMLGTTDMLNRALDYGVLSIHRSHQLTTYGTYNLPLGPNGYLFRDSSGWVKKLVEGWQLSWISSLTSGIPGSVDIGTSMWGGTGVDLVRPDLFDPKSGHVTWEHNATNGWYWGDKYTAVPDPRCATPTLSPQLVGSCEENLSALALASDPDTIVFQKAQPGVRGNFAQNMITGPGRWGLDVAMSKDIEFMEGKRLNFRVDVANIFNHPQPTNSDPLSYGGATYNYRDYWWTNPQFGLNSSSQPFGYIGYKAGHRVFTAKIRISF